MPDTDQGGPAPQDRLSRNLPFLPPLSTAVAGSPGRFTNDRFANHQSSRRTGQHHTLRPGGLAALDRQGPRLPQCPLGGLHRREPRYLWLRATGRRHGPRCHLRSTLLVAFAKHRATVGVVSQMNPPEATLGPTLGRAKHPHKQVSLFCPRTDTLAIIQCLGKWYLACESGGARGR